MCAREAASHLKSRPLLLTPLRASRTTSSETQPRGVSLHLLVGLHLLLREQRRLGFFFLRHIFRRTVCHTNGAGMFHREQNANAP